jgi:hypothetical protein
VSAAPRTEDQGFRGVEVHDLLLIEPR